MKNLKLEYDSNSEWLQEYNIKISKIGNKTNETEIVGMTFHLQRYSKPFIEKYYIPCIVLIILTSVSFFVPPKLVPGRGGMLVTLFLVLSNTSSASKVLQAHSVVFPYYPTLLVFRGRGGKNLGVVVGLPFHYHYFFLGLPFHYN